ncbi:hypothetical protein EBT25_09695 [bacterium]|nr:hypothetical protein [bacterium]
MEIPVSVGEWMQDLCFRMDNAEEGDCFLLPSPMHLHAYELVKEAQFPEKNFRVKVGNLECLP